MSWKVFVPLAIIAVAIGIAAAEIQQRYGEQIVAYAQSAMN